MKFRYILLMLVPHIKPPRSATQHPVTKPVTQPASRFYYPARTRSVSSCSSVLRFHIQQPGHRSRFKFYIAVPNVKTLESSSRGIASFPRSPSTKSSSSIGLQTCNAARILNSALVTVKMFAFRMSHRFE